MAVEGVSEVEEVLETVEAVDLETEVDEADSVVEVVVVASGLLRVVSEAVEEAEVHPEEEEAGVVSEGVPRLQWSLTDMKVCLSAEVRRMLW